MYIQFRTFYGTHTPFLKPIKRTEVTLEATTLENRKNGGGDNKRGTEGAVKNKQN